MADLFRRVLIWYCVTREVYMGFKQYLEEATTQIAAENDGSHYTHIEDELYVRGSKGIPKILVSIIELVKGIPTTEAQTKIDGCVHQDTIIMTNRGEIKISDVNSSDTLILGHDFNSGLDKMCVLTGHSIQEGKKNWYQIEFENGHSIIATEDHEVYTTNRKWVESSKLVIGDNVKQV